jgi:hypothetical protein
LTSEKKPTSGGSEKPFLILRFSLGLRKFLVRLRSALITRKYWAGPSI